MDIDIDLADRSQLLGLIPHRIASLKSGNPHNTGVYFTEIPHNPITNTATVDYVEAEKRGYFKIDFLNVSIYQDVQDEDHLNRLMNQEPMWELLQYDEFVDQIFQIADHGDLLRKLKPKNIDQLAMVLALMRPSKIHLSDFSWEVIEREIWKKPSNGEYYFKKSHSYSYAMAVIVHMNLICEQLAEV